jgi:formylglycine-generating enzyme required for sulfatase activity
MKKKTLACLAVAVMAMATTASADPISITVPADGKSTITNAMVHTDAIESPCHGAMYRWWRNGHLVLGATADSLIISASTLTAGQTYAYHRTTRCGACGVNVTSPDVEVQVALSPIEKIVANMVLVPGGSTTLNSQPVTLNTFSIGKYEVTQAQWLAVMGSLPSSLNVGVGDSYPVYNVTWYDIVGIDSGALAYTERGVTYFQDGFCYQLSQLVGGGKHFRLPTEAEWVYAAKGGQQTNNYTYSGSNTIDDVAWYRDNSGNATHTVGTTNIANELGIYDMSGNVSEWCSDWYGPTYPSDSNNPIGNTSSSASYRMLLGGSWFNAYFNCTVSYRYYEVPTYGYNRYGFRLVVMP